MLMMSVSQISLFFKILFGTSVEYKESLKLARKISEPVSVKYRFLVADQKGR